MKKWMHSVLCLATVGSVVAAPPNTKDLTGYPKILVLDAESLEPIKKAEVFAIFKNPPQGWGEQGKDVILREYTDASGLCMFKGQTWVGKVNCNITATGFYPHISTLPVVDATPARELVFATSVITCSLQRVKHPIPLIMNRGYMPTEDEKLVNTTASYDMFKFDWLPPLGTGEVADVVLTRLPRISSGIVTNRDEDVGECFEDQLEVVFPGSGNGIVEMKKSNPRDVIRIAPLRGYENRRIERRGRNRELQRYKTFDTRHKTQMCFRIRSQVDEKGNVVGGYYGKINGGFTFGQTQWYKGSPNTVWTEFFYCLNPEPGCRSLEYNGVNLCPTAPKDEWWVREW